MPLSLFLVGATRGTGRLVLEQALAAGHRVTALVRDPSRAPAAREGLRVVLGDATDADTLAAVLHGHDAVISTIGAPPGSRDTVRTRSAQALVQAMERAQVRRLISLSSHGVAESRPHLPWMLRLVIVPFYLEGVFADHAGQEGVIRESGLDWTLVRPPSLNDAVATPDVPLFAGVDPGGQRIHMSISRATVASFLLDGATQARFVRQAPVLARLRH